MKHHVAPYLNGWAVRHGEVYRGPYASQDLALQVAVLEVRELRIRGIDAQVIVEGPHGEVVATWPETTQT